MKYFREQKSISEMLKPNFMTFTNTKLQNVCAETKKLKKMFNSFTLIAIFTITQSIAFHLI